MRSIVRWRDLKDEKNVLQRQEYIKEACKNLKIEADELSLGATQFENEKEWLKFIIYWIGKNLGLLHANGLIHGFLHLGNLTLAGEIVDLDSVQPVIVKKTGEGKKYRGENFFNERSDGTYVVINPDFIYRNKESRFGLPKCIYKDYRDSCFSVRALLNTLKSENFIIEDERNLLSSEFIRGYEEGFGNKEPYDQIGISRERLVYAMSATAQEIIGKNQFLAPVPED